MTQPITLLQIIDKLMTVGIKVIDATVFIESTEIATTEGIDVFVEIAKEYNIRLAYITKTILTDQDIEDSLIDDEMVAEKAFPESLLPEIQKEVLKFNKKIKNMKAFLGQEQLVKVVFPYQGIIFSFEVENEKLYPDDSEEFLTDLIIKHGDRINEQYSLDRAEKERNKRVLFDELENEIIAHDNFRNCTNETNRRNFGSKIYTEKQEMYDSKGITLYNILELVNTLWSTHKDNFKKK
jgi:hypothetical protein